MTLPGEPKKVAVNPITLMPRFWALAWHGNRKGRSPADSTKANHARHISALYLHCDGAFGDGSLDKALSNKDASTLCSMMETFFIHLSNGETISADAVKCWVSASEFVSSTVLLIEPHHGALSSVSAVLQALGYLSSSKTTNIAFARALPLRTIRDLLDVCAPASPRNPYLGINHIEWRNWLLVNLLFKGGLRRGEALLLAVDSLKNGVDEETGETRYWIDVTETVDEDLRYSKPSIKNVPSHRSVPVSEELAAIWETYLAVRPEGMTNFLLTASGSQGLSKEAVARNFEKLSGALSSEALAEFTARSGKLAVSPHDLRHTSATAAYQYFRPLASDVRITYERMESFFGWCPQSEMPRFYARTAVQQDMMNIWSNAFARQVDVLRSYSA